MRRLRQQIVEAIDEIVRPARGVGFAPDEIQKGEIENRLRGVRRRERRALAQIVGGRFPTQTQKPQITAVAVGGEMGRLRFQNPRIQGLDRGRGFRRRRGVPTRRGFVQDGVRVVGNLGGDFLESVRRFVEFFFVKQQNRAQLRENQIGGGDLPQLVARLFEHSLREQKIHIIKQNRRVRVADRGEARMRKRRRRRRHKALAVRRKAGRGGERMRRRFGGRRGRRGQRRESLQARRRVSVKFLQPRLVEVGIVQQNLFRAQQILARAARVFDGVQKPAQQKRRGLTRIGFDQKIDGRERRRIVAARERVIIQNLPIAADVGYFDGIELPLGFFVIAGAKQRRPQIAARDLVVGVVFDIFGERVGGFGEILAVGV